MPSPSTGALTLATKAKTMYRGRGRGRGLGCEGADEGDRPPGAEFGRGTGRGRGRGRGMPAEKEQLRRNLSLLKKKMHSQAGSRRSQVGGVLPGSYDSSRACLGLEWNRSIVPRFCLVV